MTTTTADPRLASLTESHWTEVSAGERFAFGANWSAFLRLVDEPRIRTAVQSLTEMLSVNDLRGRRFIDVGSGSGLFSLAAHRLGAEVHSFDYDPASVACTTELRRRFARGQPAWVAEAGSVLDIDYIASLGQYDVVYSWGVLHHTGAMWAACDQVTKLVAPGGQLFIALYNDQGARSSRWRRVKQFYCSGRLPRALVLASYVPYVVTRNFVADLLWGRNPVRRYRDYREARGMSMMHDWIDWLGGFPFEVAKPEEVFEFYRARGFELMRLRTCGGSVGCNEYVFRRLTPERGE
jgi:2-polyprenyl-6-hydroxyphenyl methylase/3-demethylubiquinone-9 3-methyltransferase